MPAMTAMADLKDGKSGLNEDAILDAFDKMREYVDHEGKRFKDEMFKLNLQVDAKMRDKIDKRDLEEIESKVKRLSLFYRENYGNS